MSENINLVLVHGLLGSLDFFEPEELLSGANIMSPNLHGYGNSPLKDKLSLQDQADFVKASIEDTTSEPCWLLGHSVGGAVVNLLASQHPELVRGIINVEGNFTINDAFWCQSISGKDPKDWEAEYELMRSDPEKWLEDSQITVSPQRLLWAENILAYQNADTVQAVAKAVVSGTDTPEYEAIVNQVMDSDIPVYLVAGEYSVKGWDIPKNVKDAAVELCVIEGTGHLMMLDKPAEFCGLIEQIIQQRRHMKDGIEKGLDDSAADRVISSDECFDQLKEKLMRKYQ